MDIGFILYRKFQGERLEKLLDLFEKEKKRLFSTLNSHSQNFHSLRLEFFLAKMKTYIGLARISEFSISKEQWLEWHKLESEQVLREVIELIQQIE